MSIIKKPRVFSIVFLVLTACTSLSAKDSTSCITLNSILSICEDVPDVTVSLVDATPGKVLGIVRLKSRTDLSYVFNIDWDLSDTLEEYAKPRAEELAAGSILQEPMFVTVQGKPAIRYDIAPLSSKSPYSGPKMLLFIDLGAGIATFIGSPTRPGVSAEDLYLGAESAAKIIHIRQ